MCKIKGGERSGLRLIGRFSVEIAKRGRGLAAFFIQFLAHRFELIDDWGRLFEFAQRWKPRESASTTNSRSFVASSSGLGPAQIPQRFRRVAPFLIQFHAHRLELIDDFGRFFEFA